MKTFNTELKCRPYYETGVIDMRAFVKGMEAFNGCATSTNVNLHVHFTDEDQLEADEIKVEIYMDHVDTNDEGLEIIFDWNACLERKKICKVHYTSLVGISE